MALRNVFRQRFRSLLSGLVVFGGVAVLILSRGFVGGLDENTIRAVVDSSSGHVLIRPADYPTSGMDHPIDNLYTPSPELTQRLAQETKAWTVRTLAIARAVEGSDELPVRLVGFNPKTDEAVFPRTNWNVQGTVPATAEDGLMLSKGLARLFEVSEGDSLILKVRTPNGAIDAQPIAVSGIFTMGNPAMDRLGIFVPADLMERLIHTPKISHVAARLGHRTQATAVAESLREVVPETTEVVTWEDETRDMLALNQIRRTALNLIVFVLLIISGLAIANTILMAAYERIREVGTLRAMGMTQGQVRSLFTLEGMIIGAIAGTIGVISAGALVFFGSIVPLDLTSQMDAMGDLPVAAKLYLQFSTGSLAVALVFGVVVAAASSIYPAFIATKMSPADAVRAD